MAIKESQTVISTIVTRSDRERIQAIADRRGLSVSQILAAVIAKWVGEEGDYDTDWRRVREHHGSVEVVVPHEIAESMGLRHGSPLAFAPIPTGAVIWRAR